MRRNEGGGPSGQDNDQKKVQEEVDLQEKRRKALDPETFLERFKTKIETEKEEKNEDTWQNWTAFEEDGLMVAIRREALPFFERAYEVIIPGFKERGQLMDPIVFGPYCSYKGERLNKDMEKNDVFATEVVGFLVKTAKEIKPESLTDESSETELRSRQEQLLAELEGFIIRREKEIREREIRGL
ncbi:MAG: hypothetical protein UX09_C0001G0012 [Candidatus Uhrbacteria bacterium GW2011_GWE2_45_35]|uniref:Uncharacterized protein n=2 Tax=Candidatus Uhriibacteriota TaxID=1752732 RepID=A0A0G1LT25_9BACT|nr:MAG: hypothetical protein UW63_C0003G0004 [Candidatus Uhrbacteria bacterium GW2011_GWF2_44_350]KKU09218.1 MAG: hypothetical protein UX09_C0001G0012 [Candidatus Uhrbacteria bacterium GW2011_GWE2_45_35]HBR80499.1 hypothetical protein [Candidatus Uhrbacteria bacterium]HCU31516.1 hypothetical protein [Candidatus Uhrbacteria bacterium]